MKTAMLAALLMAVSTPALADQKQQIEQKPGQPLYLPADQYKQHPSDLAPETDPHWQRFEAEQKRRVEEGKPAVDPYENTPTIIREETIRYEIVDDKKKKKQPKRWD